MKWSKETLIEERKEIYKKQSETRKRKYASGELKPDKNCGAGMKSKLVCEFGTFNLRSKDELIYAMYLVVNNIPFTYEEEYVTYNGKTYFSDFFVDNTIIEIKQRNCSKVLKEQGAFEVNGYKFKTLYHEDVKEMEATLNETIDVNKILNELIDSFKNKERYVISL